ncbi:MAG: PAS domain S-box protein [Bacteroidota bacterium]
MKKVLIIEDDALTSRLLENSLSRAGYEVVGCVKSGEEAIDISATNFPDFVIADIALNGRLDGIETIVALNKIKPVSFIYLTSVIEEMVFNRAKETQPSAYMIKPFNEQVLLFTIKVALDKLETERNLVESEEKFKSLVSCIPDIVFILKKGKITYMNQSAEKLTGYRNDEMMNKSLFAFVVDKYKPLLIENIMRQINGNEVEPYEIEIIRKTGDKMPMLIRSETLKTKEERAFYFILTDISYINELRKAELFRVEAELQKTKSLIEQKNMRIDSILEGEENEKKRIASEIHDGIGQMLVAAKLNLENAKKIKDLNEIENRLESITNYLITIIQEARALSNSLLPKVLYEKGLSSSIEFFVEELKTQVPFQITYFYSNVSETISEKVRLHIYRIVQEAFNNIVKHAKATEVNLSLIGSDDTLILFIEDDGQGFDLKKVKKYQSSGLRNMRNRAESMGGELYIESSPSNGTSIELNVPVKEK